MWLEFNVGFTARFRLRVTVGVGEVEGECVEAGVWVDYVSV